MSFQSMHDHIDSFNAAGAYSFLVDHVRGYAIYLLNPDGTIAQWNRSAERLKGYVAEEVLGKHYSMFYEADAVAAQMPAELLRIASTEGTVEAEGMRLRKDGSRFWANVVITAIRDDTGTLLGFAKITRDLTLRHEVEKGLRSDTEMGIQVIHNVQEGVAVLDRDLRYRVWNPFLECLTGLAQDRVAGRHVMEVFPSLEGDATLALIEGALQGNHLRSDAKHLPRECRRSEWIETEYIPLRVSNGGVEGVIVKVRDITESLAQQNKIARLTRISTVLSSINSAIVRIRDRMTLLQEACQIAVTHGTFQSAWIGLVDSGELDGRVVAAAGSNVDYFERVRLTRREDSPARQRPANVAMRTRAPVICNDIATDLSLAEVRDELLAKQHRSMTALPLIVEGNIAGTLCLFADVVDFFDDPEMKLLNELAGDISFGLEYIQKDQRLNYLAYYDPITGLPNRSFFLEQLAKKLTASDRKADQLVMCVGDIRRLGQINESFGRNCGDVVLREAARRFQRYAYNPESVAYLGNGRFVSTMSETSGPAEVAHRIENAVKAGTTDPFVFDDIQLSINTVVGVALYSHDGTTAEQLLGQAEAALTQAKAANVPYRFYEVSLNKQVADVLKLESKLRLALERGEYVLHYQPKVRTSDRTLCGLEALLRWNDPERGLVSPAEFIPVLEQTGLIIDVGWWVIEQALTDFHACCESGMTLPRVAVNVSVKQLQSGQFLARLRNLAERHCRIGEALELEITESMVMENIGSHIDTLRSIKEMGIKVAIDDFGTGYSSLSYLAKLPIDTLKIDRSFIRTMTDEQASTAIVSSIISLAHSLDLKVVAEGVETEEHARFLRLLKCDEMQGYLLSRPLPLAALSITSPA